MALAAVLDQFDRVEIAGQGGEGAAGVDLGQLVGVADQYHFGVGPFRQGEEAVQFAGADHPRLVDDQHRPPRQAAAGAGAAGVDEEPVDGLRGDPGAALELRRPPGPPTPPRYTGVPACSQAARAASRANVFPAPARPTTTSTPAPERVSRATMARCSSDSDGRAANACSNTATGTTATPASTRRRAPSSTRVSTASISAVENRGPPDRRRGVQGDDGRVGEEVVGDAAHLGGRGAGGQRGGHGSQDVAAIEARRVFRQPVRADQVGDETVGLGRLRACGGPPGRPRRAGPVPPPCCAQPARRSARVAAGALAGRVAKVAISAAFRLEQPRLVQGGGDLGAALREPGQLVGRVPGQVGGAVTHRPPLQPQRCR